MSKLPDSNKGQNGDVLVIGMALFSMFFGAGNLIFPPTLGMTSGTSWFLGFLCFFIADIGLGFAAIIAMMKGSGRIKGITAPVGKIAAIIINTSVIVCIGPLLAIPRTAATTFEMGVQPATDSISLIVFSIIFFAITFALTIRPSGVIDIIGKFLTPALFICLIALIIVGFTTPLSTVQVPTSETVVKDGILAGYQAMDVLGALGFAMIVIATVIAKGYTTDRDKARVTAKSCAVSGIMLFIVYGGLTYLGASSGSVFASEGLNQAGLLVAITNGLLGKWGVLILGLVVGLACLTTAVGLTSAAGSYFEELTKGKLKYGVVVTIVILISLGFCNLGLTQIISLSAPILTVLYPVVIVLIVLAFFKKKLRNLNVHRTAVIVTFIVSLLSVASGYTDSLAFIHKLPLDAYGFNWLLPAIVGGIVGRFIPYNGKTVEEIEETF
ncbi:MAG: branched-chain amino acid transport system II carrier protein [Anaerovoracaceae bacterium]